MPCNGHCHYGRCRCECDHDDPELGIQYSLYKKIDKEKLICLNEAVEGSCKSIFKPYEQRLNFDTVRNYETFIMYVGKKISWRTL